MNIEICPKEYERKINWDDAIFYCQLLVIDDKCDWRLPTLDELEYIYKLEHDFDDGYYWSSTPKYSNTAWAKNMSNGYKNHYTRYGKIFVRAVRTI